MALPRPSAVAIAAAALLLSAGCGLTASEQDALARQASVSCPMVAPAATWAEAATAADLVVSAHPGQSYFVDSCHRAFVLNVDSVWKGVTPQVPLLAIVRVSPASMVESWSDMGRGDHAVFLLERDPDVPEAWRPVSDSTGIATDADVDLGSLHALVDGTGTGAPAAGQGTVTP